jgi:hypothetical protein
MHYSFYARISGKSARKIHIGKTKANHERHEGRTKGVFLRAIGSENGKQTKAIPPPRRKDGRPARPILAQRFFLALIEIITSRISPSAYKSATST